METEKLITVHKCARCRLDHPNLKFNKFKNNSIEDCNGVAWDWWGLCPVTLEPILLKIVIRNDPSEV